MKSSLEFPQKIKIIVWSKDLSTGCINRENSEVADVYFSVFIAALFKISKKDMKNIEVLINGRKEF